MPLIYRNHTISALVFDFDGTLAAPTLDFSLMRREAMRALSQFGTLPEDSSEPLMEQLAAVCATLDADCAAAAREATYVAIKEVEVEAAGRSSLFPFVRPLLVEFRERGLPFAIITRNCPEAVFTVFPDVNESCACLLTRDDVEKVKPHPEHLERALAAMGCLPQEALMVGDHPMDIVVGHAAGTLTAGVLSGEGSRERLEGVNPNFLAGDVGELMRMILREGRMRQGKG